MTVLLGAGIGLAWGVVARIWMRLISETPEFSIVGTAFILIATTVFGACVGLAWAGRLRGWKRWKQFLPRILVVLTFLPFGVAGGAPLMLTVLLATLAMAVRRAPLNLWWKWSIQALLLVPAVAAFGFVSWDLLSRPGIAGVLLWGIYILLLYPLFIGVAIGLAQPPDGPTNQAVETRNSNS